MDFLGEDYTLNSEDHKEVVGAGLSLVINRDRMELGDSLDHQI